MEPIICKSIFKRATWGGTNIGKLFDIKLPYEDTSEMWTVSAHPKGETPIIQTVNSQENLANFYKAFKVQYFGSACKKYSEFPLLAKFIDANENLSVQVHPDDNYAQKRYNSYGKTEAWYIMSAKPGAKIVYGLRKGCTMGMLKYALKKNCIETVLNYVPVKTGEIYYIPSGMVHALLGGVMVYEIQQSSDITYRLYDWGRENTDRPLTVEDALNVINPEERGKIIQNGVLESDYFITKKFSAQNDTSIKILEPDSFTICSALSGNLSIEKLNRYQIDIKAGQSIIIPAGENAFITGEGEFIASKIK